MYKKIINIGLFLILAAFNISCNTQFKEEKTAATPQPVGNDRDNHGCIASAGYQWSELLKDCIRPWEKGVKLIMQQDTEDSSTSYAVYLILNTDTSKIEVFLPKETQHPILTRDMIGHTKSWSNPDNNDLMVEYHNGKWAIFCNEEMTYKEQ